jgi:predicted polyphosphate/ATP-dependent NAD kinase
MPNLSATSARSTGAHWAILIVMIDKLGLIINPNAGLGGPLGFKGTDLDAIIAQAHAQGIEPLAPLRAKRALGQFAGLIGQTQFVTCSGVMGENAARAMGMAPLCLAIGGDATTAADTITAAQQMAAAGVDLILFAGGDGTARNIMDALSAKVPVLGIPCGVKMHSAVFGTSPETAGRLVHRLLSEPPPMITRCAEVMDIDEAAFRANRLVARLYGYLRVPADRHSVQQAKASYFGSDEAELEGAALELASELQADCAYIIGPGATAKKLLTKCRLQGTLLGVDVLLNGRLIERDADSTRLLAATRQHPAKIIVGIIGGQGHVFGRGNQQIGADIIRRVGRDNIIVLAGRSKLAGLSGRPLIIDSGDAALDGELSGFLRVRTGPGQIAIMPVM